MSQFLQLFDTWHLIRLFGLLAYFFFTMSLAFGMLSRLSVFKKEKGLFNFIHMSSSWSGLFTLLAHILILLINHYQPYTILEIIVPFAATYEPVASALGTIDFFIFLIVLFTSDVLLGKMNRALWKWLHLLVFPAWVLMLLHGLIMGTDSATWWGAVVYGASAFIILFIFTAKVMDREKKPESRRMTEKRRSGKQAGGQEKGHPYLP